MAGLYYIYRKSLKQVRPFLDVYLMKGASLQNATQKTEKPVES